ncbi:MarR family transcriptional regulator [Roseomonas nepalensis]|uniref:MarR family transcriptional regulator n=1 Tax=Muricoccus nepalensis TaxID=1854500 RepID=A0A502G506_9PROT|nr:MarR family winged helix-turn-helix transcriptional regulator [Roseomonas nepalensis]TPG56958.1 MarR family transcriptional regulator [Roseomonas nepalensis]
MQDVPTAEDAWRRDNVGRLLHEAVHRFESRVLARLAARGFGEVRLAHVGVTRNLDTAGTRATELARRASMTKQAMGELIEQCVALRLVSRETDPADRRAKTVRFTAHGFHFLDEFRRAVAEAQAEMGGRLGEARLDALLSALRDYARPDGEAPTCDGAPRGGQA